MVDKAKLHELRLECGHFLDLEKRPNPRKVWPDPQMCETCKKKKRVVEIKSPRVEVTHTTAPNAPKPKRKRKGAKKK